MLWWAHEEETEQFWLCTQVISLCKDATRFVPASWVWVGGVLFFLYTYYFSPTVAWVCTQWTERTDRCFTDEHTVEFEKQDSRKTTRITPISVGYYSQMNTWLSLRNKTPGKLHKWPQLVWVTSHRWTHGWVWETRLQENYTDYPN